MTSPTLPRMQRQRRTPISTTRLQKKRELKSQQRVPIPMRQRQRTHLPQQPWSLHQQPWSLHQQPWSLHRQPWSLHRQPWSLHRPVQTSRQLKASSRASQVPLAQEGHRREEGSQPRRPRRHSGRTKSWTRSRRRRRRNARSKSIASSPPLPSTYPPVLFSLLATVL